MKELDYQDYTFILVAIKMFLELDQAMSYESKKQYFEIIKKLEEKAISLTS